VRILLVEDNEDSSQLLKMVLDPYGEVKLAFDGVEALEMLQKAREEEKPYDLVLLDVMMPRMDGIETLSRLREEEQKRGVNPLQRINVIMITAYADEQNMQKALQLGCEGYLFKTQGKGKIIERLHALGLIE
jgi:two-component system, chemotaxis family, chemotaxis protein CheY